MLFLRAASRIAEALQGLILPSESRVVQNWIILKSSRVLRSIPASRRRERFNSGRGQFSPELSPQPSESRVEKFMGEGGPNLTRPPGRMKPKSRQGCGLPSESRVATFMVVAKRGQGQVSLFDQNLAQDWYRPIHSQHLGLIYVVCATSRRAGAR